MYRSLLWPRWAPAQTGLLAALSDIMGYQGLISAHQTTPMLQVPTPHWKRHKGRTYTPCPKGVFFNIVERKNINNEPPEDNMKQYTANLLIVRHR